MAKKKSVAKAKTAKKPAAKAKTKKAASKPKAVAKPAKKAAKVKKPEPKATAKKIVAKKAAPLPKKPAKELIEAPVHVAAEPSADVTAETPEEIVLTDAEGRRYCRVKDCDQIATVDSYCRYHYLLYWKKIQVRKKILSEGKLERYIEELTARYPDKFLDMLRKDLRSEKEFLAAIQELEIDESATEGEFEDEAQNYIDEVRGISETTPVSGDEEGF
jgi:outer membrane biosynthesis protein TonB